MTKTQTQYLEHLLESFEVQNDQKIIHLQYHVIRFCASSSEMLIIRQYDTDAT
jgi:hypothetical protein